MKTGQIIAITAGGALGALLLGGGAFAAGVALGDNARVERVMEFNQIREHSAGVQQMRGAGPQAGGPQQQRGHAGQRGDHECDGEHEGSGVEDGDGTQERPGAVDPESPLLEGTESLTP